MPLMTSGQKTTSVSCFQRVKMGFGMGFTIGMTAGVVIGGISCFRSGLRGRELLGQVSKTVISFGGSFGTFMAVGSAIRC
ncbi:hypothetical protein GJ496_007413 [Pomphorhynchus laevis]|nr:hypothetical protein GJ496_007413 [Pomphorhynchus laevis]